MTGPQARTAANVILVSAGLAAAYLILTNPPLRRIVARSTRLWLGASLPVFLMREARQAWVESGRTP
jgi:hypothetical protein